MDTDTNTGAGKSGSAEKSAGNAATPTEAKPRAGKAPFISLLARKNILARILGSSGPKRRKYPRKKKAREGLIAEDELAKEERALQRRRRILECADRANAERDKATAPFFKRFIISPGGRKRVDTAGLAARRLTKTAGKGRPTAPGAAPVADPARLPGDPENAGAFPQIAGLITSAFPQDIDQSRFLRWLSAEYRGEVRGLHRRKYRLSHPLPLRLCVEGKPLQAREFSKSSFVNSVIPLGQLAARLLGVPVVSGSESRYVLKGGLRWGVGFRLFHPGEAAERDKERLGPLNVYPAGPVGDMSRELPGFARYLFDMYERGGRFWTGDGPVRATGGLLARAAERGDETDVLGRGLVCLPGPESSMLWHIVDYESPSFTLCGVNIDLDGAGIRRIGISRKRVNCPACAKYAVACRGVRLSKAAFTVPEAKAPAKEEEAKA